MPRIEYRTIRFAERTLATIAHAVEIAETYAAEGYSLTLRQLYYRFVAADLIPNKQSEYKRLGSIITDARYAGMFDWSLLEDRTRDVAGGDGVHRSPVEAVYPDMYARALWAGQPNRVEVWVEKDALVDVIGQAAGRMRVPYFSCRGYTSASELWAAAQRIEGYLDDEDVTVTILHLGDHDPSGIDMTRDITDRLAEFLDGDEYDSGRLTVRRIALNMDQVRRYDPPPNPAKGDDPRFADYTRIHGTSSWELDALEPRILDELISSNIRDSIENATAFETEMAREKSGRRELEAVRVHYADVVEHLRTAGKL